jgi:Mce-associated membrane protein
MPPPRRRRPVQPATRVRLPRTVRPAGSSATDDAPEATVAADARDDVLAPQEAAVPAGVPVEELASEELASEELASEELAPEELGEDETATGDDDTDDDTEDQAGQATDAAPRRGMRLPACLAGVAVILGGLAVWFGVEAANTGSGVNEQNTAVLNSAATTEVNKQIAAAVSTIFSYNYADTAKTRSAAQNLLTGKAIQEYNTLFKLVEQDAPTEKLVLTTTVTNSGVSMLSGNRAQVLIFANQQDTGGSTRSTTDAGAMFSVDAVQQGGTWKIDNIDTFSAGS